MTEFKVLFVGLPGAGKTMAIGTVSDIPVVNTDVRCSSLTEKFTDEFKKTVTTGIDYGELNDRERRFRLYGVPGHAHFDFLLDIIYGGVDFVIALFDISRSNYNEDISIFMNRYAKKFCQKKYVIGIVNHSKKYHDRLLWLQKEIDKVEVRGRLVDITNKEELRNIILSFVI